MLSSKRTHAIVIGGGIAGLLAARVLLNHFEQITLIERDHYPKEPIFRPGVPQSRHIHILLLRGQHAVETLFPGIREKLLKQGAIECNYGNESYYYGEKCPRLPSIQRLQGWNCSRLLLEWQIRKELAVYPQLSIIEGYEVVRLLGHPRSVHGVQFRNHARDHLNELQTLEADLVVDASGRLSSAGQWLEALGNEAPRETVLPTGVGYATRVYEGSHAPFSFIAIQSTLQPRHTGVLMMVEAGRMMVGLAGIGDNAPSTEETAFLEFAKDLPDPVFYEAIKDALPISKIYGYRQIDNRWRHFEMMKQWPEGLIVMGDAACTFNPIYGQGMTVAALEALLLDRCLHSAKKQKNFARLFQRKAAQIIALPWRLATLEREGASGFAHWYLDRLIALLSSDHKIWLTFLEVIHMIRSPIALFHPVIVAKVLAQHRQGSAGQ